ncbi:hypothetical protein IEQ34_018645 [Dendrobium chrysotoxum]|uniref:Uncharacterized protein n=1 Tax=Dendrobium chrysotoxum TaxID=161865 RepID=A0AAV7G4N6_DENCH|nr:hypothetical protein IEQ34_018645 [Dendrobium chrysotoxum]
MSQVPQPICATELSNGWYSPYCSLTLLTHLSGSSKVTESSESSGSKGERAKKPSNTDCIGFHSPISRNDLLNYSRHREYAYYPNLLHAWRGYLRGLKVLIHLQC